MLMFVMMLMCCDDCVLMCCDDICQGEQQYRSSSSDLEQVEHDVSTLTTKGSNMQPSAIQTPPQTISNPVAIVDLIHTQQNRPPKSTQQDHHTQGKDNITTATTATQTSNGSTQSTNIGQNSAVKHSDNSGVCVIDGDNSGVCVIDGDNSGVCVCDRW